MIFNKKYGVIDVKDIATFILAGFLTFGLGYWQMSLAYKFVFSKSFEIVSQVNLTHRLIVLLLWLLPVGVISVLQTISVMILAGMVYKKYAPHRIYFNLFVVVASPLIGGLLSLFLGETIFSLRWIIY